MTTNQPKHTPEPWSVFPDNGNGFYIKAMNEPEETITAHCHDYPHMAGLENGTWEAKANAQRIVQCVNACAGIANPEALPDIIRDIEIASGFLSVASISNDDGARIKQQQAREILYKALAKLGTEART